MATTSTARIRSLAISTRLCSQRSTKVPAIGPEQDVGQRGRKEDQARRQRRVGQRVDEHAQRHLVKPVAEQADRLGQPEAGKSRVQGEADVRVAAERARRACAGNGAAMPAPIGPPRTIGRSRPKSGVDHDPAARPERHAALWVLLPAHQRTEHERGQAGANENVPHAGDVGN